VTKLHNIWGINFLLSTLDEYYSFLEETILEKNKIILTGINPYSLSLIKKNPKMLGALRITTIANVDGILLKYSLQLLGYDVPERLDTPSVFIKLMELCVKKRFKIFLLGSRDEEIELIKKELINKFSGASISGSHHGFFDKDDEDMIVQKINECKSDVIIMGMPSPKKEFFIHDNHSRIDFRIALGVGGMFDILAGKKKLAPLIIRKMNIEWLYRFVQEPRRLLVRYKDMFLYFSWFFFKTLNK
jgi:N-acetylglucosaminyldiphosphoundecaprenol N-acetyl-beta-D-mannosaminyltransferase